MAVTLQVREVHEALYFAGGGPAGAGPGAPSNALLGRMFHDTFADLIGPDPARNLDGALEDVDPDDAARRPALERHLYERLVGPRLRREQARLHGAAGAVLAFWEAARAMADWLLELRGAGGLVGPAGPLECELRGPGWADAVRLTGVPDALVRDPRSGRWCVVELKLGRAAPEADLGQACLYHQMLDGSGLGPDGSLALVRFEPARRERLLAAADLGPARRALLDLIGRLAEVGPRPPGRVDPKGTPPVAPPPDPGRDRELGERLVKVLDEYAATARLDGPPVIGPTFVRFRVAPGRGVRVAAIEARADELRVRLGLDAPPRIGIEAGRVVIDLPRPDRQAVAFSQIRDQLPPLDPRLGSARVPLGVDLDGHLRTADLSQPEHTHILVAGTTGSGKSEWLRAAIAGLIAANTPETLRLLLIDPKRTAFSSLKDSPYLYAPIIHPDEGPVSEVLARLADEMDDRYRRFEAAGAESLADYVGRTGRPLPRIVCLCDEYADLLLRDRQERRALEEQVARLGAKARAAGIHLILATQQPSREVIKGALDANIPARVGLKTNNPIESRMLLGERGAEALLGAGDLLFKDLGAPVRLQSAYLPPGERDATFAGPRAVAPSAAR